MPAWDKIEALAKHFEDRFNSTGDAIEGNLAHQYNWHNSLWNSNKYRRAHVEIVDNRDTHGIYILHATIFAHTDDASPIWGFDAVCGKNKITGAFHDFSLVTPDHYMCQWFREQVKNITWNKQRELPEWARNIFSPAMVAAGNISEQHELDNITELGIKTLEYYLANVGDRIIGQNFKEQQNYYCKNKKLNPHVYRSMIAMGVEEAVIRHFVEQVLFPELA